MDAPERAPLRATVVERLRDAIVDGTLAPGEKLRDGEIAAWLGVSRTPVREAILELTASGLVRSAPGRSSVVAPDDEEAVRDARAVVGAMHRVAVRDAAPHLGPGHFERLRAANAAFAAATRRGDVEAALRADDAFHAVWVDASANTAVRSVIDAHTPLLRRAERLRFSSADSEASISRHERLIALCEAGDVAGAAALAEETWTELPTKETA